MPGNREATYNDPAWALGMREQAGGFPPIKSLDEAGVEANLPGGHCCALTFRILLKVATKDVLATLPYW